MRVPVEDNMDYGNVEVTRKYKHHLERVFGDLANTAWIDCEYILKERVGDADFLGLKEKYEKHLAKTPSLSTKLIVADDVILHVLGIYPLEVLGIIPPKFQLYYPICTVDEINRICRPQNTEDLLLAIRGEAAAKNVRLHRVLLSKYNTGHKDWSLTSYFSNKEFADFRCCLNTSDKSRCNITAGFAFTTEPNGSCIRSKFGNYVVVSEALRYFLYFMNIFYLGHGVPLEDRMTSLLIAARVMMYLESLDFDLDPRGKIPRKTEKLVQLVTQKQIQFVIGHEYYHHILGHLTDKAITTLNISANTSAAPLPILNWSQKQELDADFAAIHRPNYSKSYRSDLLDAALLFFISLDMYSVIKEYCLPSVQHFKTHPDPLDRLKLLRNKISYKFGMDQARIDEFLDWNERAKRHLLDDWLPFNVDVLEGKSSFYFSNYDHGAKVDRIDY